MQRFNLGRFLFLGFQGGHGQIRHERLHATRCFLDNFQHEALGNRLAEIEQDYRLMCDFLRKGFPDEKREMLYERLLDKLYSLTHDIELDYRIVNDPKVGAYARPSQPFAVYYP